MDNTVTNNELSGLAGTISAASDVTGGVDPVNNTLVKGNTGQGMGAQKPPADPNLIATVNNKNLVKSGTPTYTTGGVDPNAFPQEILT